MDVLQEQRKQTVLRIVREQLGLPLSHACTDDSNLTTLGADSLDLVEIIMAVEDEFSIEIPDAAVLDQGRDNWTVGALVAEVERWVQ